MELVIAIGFAFLGGILLNLMPCVFPILAMKALTVVQSKDLSKKDRWIDSAFYTSGILVFFWVLYLLFHLLKSGGSSLGWGFQLQNPAFLFILILFFLILAFQMLGWIEFTIGVSGKISQLSSQKNKWGSFISGGVAVLVATPCTAPFMGSALAFALAQPPIYGLIVFTSLGLGMAIPIALVQNIPFISHFIPKPGAWMVVFKEILAFPLMLTSAWLFWVLIGVAGKDESFYALTGIIFIFFQFWLSKRISNGRLKKVLFLIMVFSSIGIAITTQKLSSSHSQGKISIPFLRESLWNPGFESSVPYSPENLELALQSDHPVFLYFTADWCVTCKFNEKSVFRMERFSKFISDQNVLVLKADWTNEDPMISKAIESYGRSGVPLYVLYKKVDRKNPIFLPQILTVDIAIKEFQF